MVADRLVPAACSRRGDGYPGSASEGGTIAKGGGRKQGLASLLQRGSRAHVSSRAAYSCRPNPLKHLIQILSARGVVQQTFKLLHFIICAARCVCAW